MSDKVRWTWIPNVSVGPFRFGEPLPSGLPSINLVSLYKDVDPFDESFDVNNGAAQIWIDEGKFHGAEVASSLFLGSKNLIGMSGEEAMKLIGGGWTIEDPDEFGDRRLLNDELGVWLWEEDSFVDSVTVFRDDEDDE